MFEEIMTPAGAGILGGFLAGLIVVAVILGLAMYIYMALALMTIGKKLKIGPAWLAWIPVANLFYMAMLAGYEWYYGLLIFAGAIPGVGPFVMGGLMIWWWWKISEARHREGWLGILMIIPIANLIVPGILAWTDAEVAVKKKKK